MKQIDSNKYRKAKGIVKYVLSYSYENDSADALNTLQVLTDGIKTGVMWYGDTISNKSNAKDICTLAVQMFARYEQIFS